MSTHTLTHHLSGTPGAAALSCAVPALRLTRRGRLLVTALALLVMLAGLVALSAGTQATGSATPVVYAEVVVQPGQTLWELAQETAPAVDPRVTVRSIIDLNDLDDAALEVGQRLRLPAAAV